MTMTNTNVPDGAKILAYIALVWLAIRSLSVYTFVFLGLNLEVCRAAAIQVQGRGTTCSSAPNRRRTRPQRQGDEAAASNPRHDGKPKHARQVLSVKLSCYSDNAVRNAPKATECPTINPTQQSPRHTPQSTPPPPPYSFSAPSSLDTKQSTDSSLVELYENIIAADAQTIQVQQQTLASQQDIIRAQSQMIVKLRHLLEEQDRRIEVVDEARGLRRKRPGMDGVARSRSS